MRRRGMALGTLALVLAMLAATRPPASPLRFRVFAQTSLRLTDIVWTGRQFLYVDNTTNRVAVAGPSGSPLHPFAAMPRQVEETRCQVSPGMHGFAAGDLYCHAPDNTIYRIGAAGRQVTVFARLPHAPRSDGALAFDADGAFGYTLLVATGRSGGSAAAGGAVYALDPGGHVRLIGRYPGPGGADEIAVAPRRFGSASREVLLAVDAGRSGSLVAMDAQGRAHTLVRLPDRPNPIAVLVPGRTPPAGTAPPGLYVTDTLSRAVYSVSAAALRPYAGAVVVGSELHARFWVVRPHGSGFVASALVTTLRAPHYNLEGAVYLAG